MSLAISLIYPDREFVRVFVLQWGIKRNRPVSRVLSRTVIHLRRLSPDACSDLPRSRADHTLCPSIWSCSGRGLPCRRCCQRRGALLPHLFTLAGSRRRERRRFVFCGTFRRLAPPRRYLAPCPVEPGLSSIPQGRYSDRPAGSRN